MGETNSIKKNFTPTITRGVAICALALSIICAFSSIPIYLSFWRDNITHPAFATAAFQNYYEGMNVLGIIWLISGPVSIIVAIIALVKIRAPESRKKGRAIAIAAIVITFLAMYFLPRTIGVLFIQSWESFVSEIGKSSLKRLSESQSSYFSEHGHYCKSFKELERRWDPAPQYVFFLSDSEVSRTEYAPQKLQLPSNVKPFVEDKKYFAVAATNLDHDPDFYILAVNEKGDVIIISEDITWEQNILIKLNQMWHFDYYHEMVGHPNNPSGP
jgi:hypothetical protein